MRAISNTHTCKHLFNENSKKLNYMSVHRIPTDTAFPIAYFHSHFIKWNLILLHLLWPFSNTCGLILSLAPRGHIKWHPIKVWLLWAESQVSYSVIMQVLWIPLYKCLCSTSWLWWVTKWNWHWLTRDDFLSTLHAVVI